MKRKLFFLAAFLTATVMNLSAATAGAAPDMHDFLYFVGLNGNDTVRLNKYATTDVNLSYLTATFEYSTDRKTWKEYTWGTYGDPVAKTALGAAIALNQGDTVFFRAKGDKGENATMSNSNANFNFAFGADDSISAGGNAMSLYDAECKQDSMTAYGFMYLFREAKQLVSASELKLTATQLAPYCYYQMFANCAALTQAPELKATTLAEQCYNAMFYGCTSLIQAPELKATTLAKQCYANMFRDCSSLQVDTCADGNCDGVMFEPTTIGDEPASWNLNMFKGCKGDAVGNIQLNGHYCIKDGLDYLYFVGLNGNDTVRLNKYATSDYFLTDLTATFEYSKDRKTWTEYTWGTYGDPVAKTALGAAIALNQGDTVFFRAKGTKGENATMSDYNGHFIFMFGADDSIAAGGNTMSLCDAFCEQTSLMQYKYGFCYLFQNAKQLVSAPKLPATTLAEYCYYYMFSGCTSLITAPALPATTLEHYCYKAMFRDCASLTQAPELKATILANECYSYMFKGCSSLQVDTCTGSCDGVKLEPTTIGDEPASWNMEMFDECKGTVTTPQLNGHYCIKEYKEEPAEPDMHDFLYFVGLNGNDTVRLNKYESGTYVGKLTATFEYSKDRINWNSVTWASSAEPASTYQGNPIALNQGDTVWFRAKGENGKNATLSNSSPAYFNFAFGADDSIAAGGNTMSLYDATCEQTTMTEYGFYKLFINAKQLVTAPKLPATELAAYCYNSIFCNCTSLTTAPALPATTLAPNCYGSMFKDCTSLTTAPALPVTTLLDACYGGMFRNCTSLTKAPELKATTLAKECYGNMFRGCTALIQAPELKATTLAEKCYNAMFYGCTSLQVDTCTGSCDGVKFEPTTIGDEPASWNLNMFKDCKGAAADNIQLGGHYCIKEWVDTTDYLHFVGLNGNDTVRLNKVGKDYANLTATFEYSTDRINWSAYTWDATDSKTGAAIELKNAGDTVFFRAKGTNGKNATMSFNASNYFQFVFGADDSISAGGNAMSLYDAECKQDSMTAYGFMYLFREAKQLVSASELKLTATQLATYSYYFMFYICTALTQAPELKATTLAKQCYANMFRDCSSLQVDTCADGNCDGAELVVPDTTAAPSDWNLNMFKGCKGDAALTAATGIQLGGHYCIKEYVPITITAEFDMQGHGEQVDPQTIASGSKFKKPADPTATGVDFDGWFWDAAGDSAFDFNQAVKSTSDTTITIYAKWVRRDYLHFVGLNGEDTVRLNKVAYNANDLDKLTATFEYSKDRKTWTAYDTWGTYGDPVTKTALGAAIELAQGDTVFFRAKGDKGENATMSYNDVTYFNFAFNSGDSIAAGGNAMSLYDAECKQDSMTAYGFMYLFREAKQLVSASELKLTATTLAPYCYYQMFANCAALTQAPELKATTLAESCYALMFSNCTKLQVDALLGSCSGAELVVPDTATAPREWNKKMFNGCHVYDSVRLGGSYCISEWQGPRAVELKSVDSTRVYDGTPLVADRVIITGQMNRNNIQFTNFASQTNVGQQQNTFEYTLKVGSAADYAIDTVYGKLKVDFINTSNDPIRVKIEDITHLYDGQTVHATYAVTGGLTAGDSVAVVMDTTELTDAGLISVKAISQKIYRGETDVTAGYIMAAIENGSIQINPREVRLTSRSSEKIYDGTPLTNDTVDISLDGFAPGEGIESFDVTGTRTQVGVSNNKFTYILQSNTKATNYTIEKVEGTLTIKSPVTAQIDSLYENWNLVFHKNKMIADFLLVDATIQVEIEPEDVHWYIMNGDQDEFDPATGLPKGDDVAANPATGFFHTEDKAMTGAYYVIVKVEEAKAKMGVEYFTSNVLKLEAPKAPVRNNAKFIQNGQLIIESNGAQYNAQGMKL